MQSIFKHILVVPMPSVGAGIPGAWPGLAIMALGTAGKTGCEAHFHNAGCRSAGGGWNSTYGLPVLQLAGHPAGDSCRSQLLRWNTNLLSCLGPGNRHGAENQALLWGLDRLPGGEHACAGECSMQAGARQVLTSPRCDGARGDSTRPAHGPRLQVTAPVQQLRKHRYISFEARLVDLTSAHDRR